MNLFNVHFCYLLFEHFHFCLNAWHSVFLFLKFSVLSDIYFMSTVNIFILIQFFCDKCILAVWLLISYTCLQSSFQSNTPRNITWNPNKHGRLIIIWSCSQIRRSKKKTFRNLRVSFEYFPHSTLQNGSH